MKLGTTLSSVAHVAILSWGLLSATAPAPLEVADVDSVPIDIIPFEDIANAVQGAQEADVTDTPAPTPTKKPETVPDASNVGDAKKDVKVETEQVADEIPTEETSEAAKAPVPEPKPTPPEPKPVEKVEETTAKATEVAALPDPVTPVKPEPPVEEPTPEPEVTKDPLEELIDQNRIPVPKVAVRPKPKPAKPNTAKTNDRKQLAELTKETGKPDAPAKKEAKKETKLQDKKKASSGGQKKSTKTASLGTTQGKASGKLSRSELDGLKTAIQRCATGLAGQLISDDLRIKVVIQLAPDGSIKKIPVVDTFGGTVSERKRYGSAMVRAVKRCAPYDFLPKNKYDTWAEIVPTFHPAKMFQ
jgi:colicin import membrane protein